MSAAGSDAELHILDDFPPVPYETWRAEVEKDLAGAPFERRLVTHTYEGIDLHPLYARRDWSAEGDPSGLPGLSPFTRGGSAIGTAAHGWEIRQELNEPDLTRANAEALDDLEHGVHGLQIRLDAAARRGFDAGNPAASLLAGRDGVMVYTLADFETLLSGVFPDMIDIGLEAGAAFLPASGLLMALWRSRLVSDRAARGAFNADPLSVLARDGYLPYTLGHGYDQMASLVRTTALRYPNVTAVRVGSAPYHHAGATAAQDLAFAMATGVEYLRAMEARGIEPAAAARQFLFNFAVGTNFFLAIGKLRAARRLWARVTEACGLPREAGAMRMHVKTSKRVVTARDPWVNILRNTACCFAAGVAGADVITTLPFDDGVGLPDPFSKRIARNTQIILQEESKIHRVIDPAGGCWFLEKLTDDLSEKAWAIFQEIERRGGMGRVVVEGWVAEQIDAAFEPRLKNIATRRDAITGVSEFPNVGERPVVKTAADYDRLIEEARGRQDARERRDGIGSPGEDLAGWAFQAASAGASIGDISGRLWPEGGAVQIAPIHPHPFAEMFEDLRDASDFYLASQHHRPRAFLANLGPVAEHTARATYARNFFEAGGFEVIGDEGHESPQEAAAAFARSGANIAVICSSDKRYERDVAMAAPALKGAGARTVVLAGFPGDKEKTYREAGVDRFIFIRCNVLQTLRELLAEEGVLR